MMATLREDTLEQALNWAEHQNFQSVAARYAKILATEVRRLREELKNHKYYLSDSIHEALNSGDGVYRP